MIGNTYNMLG